MHFLHSAIGPRVYYKFWLSENNANDAEVKHFVLNNIPPSAYAPNLGSPPVPMVISPHSFFIWDRLAVVLPPRKGHEANPVELFQWQAPGRRDQTYGPANFRETQIAVSEVLGFLRFNTAAFCGWYKARTTGCHLQNRRKTDLVTRRVVRRRKSEQNVVFQWPNKL